MNILELSCRFMSVFRSIPGTRSRTIWWIDEISWNSSETNTPHSNTMSSATTDVYTPRFGFDAKLFNFMSESLLKLDRNAFCSFEPKLKMYFWIVALSPISKMHYQKIFEEKMLLFHVKSASNSVRQCLHYCRIIEKVSIVVGAWELNPNFSVFFSSISEILCEKNKSWEIV